MLKKLNHIAIAVQDAEKAAEQYALNFGLSPSPPQILPEHGVKVIFIQLENMKIEFISPLDAHSPITGFLNKNPNGGIHHLCFDVDHLETCLTSLQKNHIEPIGFKEPKIGAHGNPVIFLSPKDFSGALIELEEKIDSH